MYETSEDSSGKSLYKMVGYTTTYEYVKQGERHARISQFLILPPYQRQGFGKSIVENVYLYFIKDSQCKEIRANKVCLN